MASTSDPPALHVMVSRLWLRLQKAYPELHSEYVQVLVLVVVPLLLLVMILLADLKLRRRVLVQDDRVTFRPSLAVRCGWAFVISLFLIHAFSIRPPNWIVLAADFLAVLELLRTFPRNLIIAPAGLRWRNIAGPVTVRWEQIACFSKTRSRLGAEYRLCGDEGNTFVVDSAVFPAWRQIIRRVYLNLEQRHLRPSSTIPSSVLDKLHRLLLPVCLVLIAVGRHLSR